MDKVRKSKVLIILIPLLIIGIGVLESYLMTVKLINGIDIVNFEEDRIVNYIVTIMYSLSIISVVNVFMIVVYWFLSDLHQGNHKNVRYVYGYQKTFNALGVILSVLFAVVAFTRIVLNDFANTELGMVLAILAFLLPLSIYLFDKLIICNSILQITEDENIQYKHKGKSKILTIRRIKTKKVYIYIAIYSLILIVTLFTLYL